MLAPDLLAVLVCPKSKAPLIYFPRGAHDQSEADGFLVCATSRLRYRIDDGVPVLIAEEAELLGPDECSRLIRRAHELGLTVPPGP